MKPRKSLEISILLRPKNLEQPDGYSPSGLYPCSFPFFSELELVPAGLCSSVVVGRRPGRIIVTCITAC